LGIHPLLTITALAERAMILLARDYDWDMAEQAAPLRPRAVPPAPLVPAVRKRSFMRFGGGGLEAAGRTEGD
jgi:hypothetical protein